MPNYSTYLNAGNLMDTCRAETLGSTRSAITAIQDTPLLAYIDWLNQDFHQLAFTEFGNEGWSFLNTDAQIQTVVNTKLSTLVDCDSTTVTVAADNPPVNCDGTTSGILCIKGSDGGFDAISYSSYASNVYTVDTTKHKPSSTHAINAVVFFMYKLPDDTGRIRNVLTNDVNEFHEYTGPGYPGLRQYKIWGNHILFSEDFGSNLVTIEYMKQPTTISSRTNNLIIPTAFQRYAIEMVNSFIYMKRRKRQDSQVAREMAMEHLQRAMGYDINTGSSEAVFADF